MGSTSQLWSWARRAKLMITMTPLYLTRGVRRQVHARSIVVAPDELGFRAPRLPLLWSFG